MRTSLCLLALGPVAAQRHWHGHSELQPDELSRELKAESPEAETLLRLRRAVPQRWPIWDTSHMEAFGHLLGARKFGPHATSAAHFEWPQQGLTSLEYLASAEWGFMAVVLAMLLTLDAVLLQSLPESRRSHVSVLLIWIAVALACCVEVWVCAGTEAGTTWLSGYLMEMLYSADHVFVMQMIFSSLDTPHRLMPKALYIAMMGSMGFRLIGFLGAPVNTRIFSWILGTVFVYAGISRLARRAGSCPDVTDSPAVRVLRTLLGERLGEFYDEDGEAILVDVKGKYRLSLLGVVLLSLLFVNFLLSFDVVLAKAESFQDVFLNFSSSALALFAIRSLFFVVRDFFSLSSLTRSTLAVVLLLMGLEMLAGHAVYVSAFTSCLVFACMLALSVGVSTLHECHEKPLSDLRAF
ncbi:unnamed protein product [Effrenium voratum]|nr:unnamed protein product [Effrenium voratum]